MLASLPPKAGPLRALSLFQYTWQAHMCTLTTMGMRDDAALIESQHLGNRKTEYSAPFWLAPAGLN